MIDLALILAAGQGSRLHGAHPDLHKALIPVGGEPLIVRTCRVLQSLGIRQVIVVTGYRGEAIRSALAGQTDLGVALAFAENTQWEKSNGLSVLAAADRLVDDYLLLMADHLFDVEIVAALSRLDLGPEEVVLAVDRKVSEIFDLDDATKVRLDRGRIAAIGKNLEEYDAIDTGLFACSPALVPALRRRAAAAGDVSLSHGMQDLAAAGNLRYHDIGSAWWQDIDTPGALLHARSLLSERDPAQPEQP